MNKTVFREEEQRAFDEATKLTRTQAFIVAVDEEEKNGLYQCQVLPDLLRLENPEDSPWYPLLANRKKEVLREGDLVWVYVTADLGVGFVTQKANTIADMPEELTALWDTLVEGLEGLDEEEDERANPVDAEIEYENAFYVEVHEGVYLFFDVESGLSGFINTNTNTAVLQQEGTIYLRAGEAYVVHADMTLKGEEHEVKGNVSLEGEEHELIGDVTHEGDWKHEGDWEQEGDTTRKGDWTLEGDADIQGNLNVGGGASPAARANETLDIIEEFETHIHISPTGPVEAPLARDMTPLVAKLVSLKQTLASQKVEID